jgi:glycerol-3-phosphate dehydrogenase
MQQKEVLVLGGSVLASSITDALARAGVSVVQLAPKDLSGGLSNATVGFLQSGVSDWCSGRFWKSKQKRNTLEILAKQSKHLVSPLPIRWVEHKEKGFGRLLNRAWIKAYGLATRKKYVQTLRENSLDHTQAEASDFSFLEARVDADRLSALYACRARENAARVYTYVKLHQIEQADQGWYVRYLLNRDEEEKELKVSYLIDTLTFDEWNAAKDIVSLLDRSQWVYQEKVHLAVPLHEKLGSIYLSPSTREPVFLLPASAKTMWITGQSQTVSTLQYQTDSAKSKITRALGEYAKTAPDRLPRFSEEDVRFLLTDTQPHIKKIAQKMKGARIVGEALFLPHGQSKSEQQLSRGIHIQGGDFALFPHLLREVLWWLTGQVRQHQSEKTSEREEELLSYRCKQALVLAEDVVMGANFDGLPKDYLAWLVQRKPWISLGQRARLVSSYGTQVYQFLGDAAGYGDLGPSFEGITASELNYLRQSELARSAQDILFRRTKAGLDMDVVAQAALIEEINHWLQTH